MKSDFRYSITCRDKCVELPFNNYLRKVGLVNMTAEYK